ncbi:MAG: hypothetical protein FWD28_10650 [Treponema sp.]|nr:hypothetical protein [Treponema sp.]
MRVLYELGSSFTWVNPEQPNQRGWGLNTEIRAQFAKGVYKKIAIALDNENVKTDGGLGGIEISFNSLTTGFCMDFKSFPWNFNYTTQTGGYTSYDDLLNRGFFIIESGTAYLEYDLSAHPNYKEFKTAMASAEWGEISIQYGIGIRHLPFINAYLKG